MIPYREYIGSLLVRTPLEGAAKRVRSVLTYRQRRRHPELLDLFLESDRIDEILRKVVKRSWNCVDVGCHVGSVLSLVAGLAPEGRHMAFEPVPYKAERLRRKFPEVDVRATALGDSAGEILFYQNLDRSGFSGLTRPESVLERWEEIVVPSARLDDEVPGGRRIDLLKVDVEGAEISVFRGAGRVLGVDRPFLIFESTFDERPGSADRTAALFSHLTEGHGYHVHTPKGFLEGAEPLTLDGFQTAHLYPFAANNYVAVPAAPGR